MAEETISPEHTAPRAIIWTLVLTVVVYVSLALVAVSAVERHELAQSAAPLSYLFEQVSGLSGKPISAIAALAMINGVLVQMVMSARVLYGMANEGLIPTWFASVDPVRRTPARATLFVSVTIFLLAASLPLVKLAEFTSMIILAVFALVNLSLFAIGRAHGNTTLYAWRYWGLFSAVLCISILLFHLFSSGLLI